MGEPCLDHLTRLMSRLDRTINRLMAQRALIAQAADLVGDLPGPIFDLGLGNGRTYDHLRETFPHRAIFAFDRAINAHPSSIPPAEHMIVGEIRDTLRHCGPRVGGKPVLIHIDLDIGDPTMKLVTDEWLGPAIVAWVPPGGIVIADRSLDLPPDFEELDRPADAPTSKHHLYRRQR